jgi:hypothetical protein
MAAKVAATRTLDPTTEDTSASLFNTIRQVGIIETLRGVATAMRPDMLAEDDLYTRLLATVTAAADDDMIGNGIDGHIDAEVYLQRNDEQYKHPVQANESRF